MVRGIEHCRGGAAPGKFLDERAEKLVGVTYRIVIRIDKRRAVGCLRLRGVIGLEESLRGRVTLAVVEVRAVGMQYDELLLAPFGKHLSHHRQHGAVLCVGSFGRFLLQKDPLVSLLSEDVDERVVRHLVGDEHGMEARLFEGGYYSLLAVDAVVILRRCGGQQHRHALVGGVRLGEHVREHHQSALRLQHGRGVPAVAVDSEVSLTRRLAYHEYVDLALVLVMRRFRTETEACRSLGIVGGGVCPLHGKHEVVAHIDRIKLYFGTVILVGGIARNEQDQSYGCRTGSDFALRPYKIPAQHCLSAQRDRS